MSKVQLEGDDIKRFGESLEDLRYVIPATHGPRATGVGGRHTPKRIRMAPDLDG